MVAAATYQARERLYNEQDGLTKNYTRHGQQALLETVIFAPKDAPEWAFDREKLWNAAEAAEDQHNRTRAKTAQTARHFELALPHELDPEQNRRLVQDFVRDNFTRKGFACDVAIHGPDEGGDCRNVHAHILVTMRTLNKSGFNPTKPRLGQAEQRAQLEHWRENWARQTARHLERAGFKMEAARMVYAHRTLDEQRQIAEARGDHEHAQALTRAPTLHEGPTATQMRREGHGSRSWVVSFNEQTAHDRERLTVLRGELASAEATLEHAHTVDRLARVHEWQRDRLERQQERERLKQADAHAWQRRDKARTASPLGQAWSERERNAESAALERDLEAARLSLARKQAEEREKEREAEEQRNRPPPVNTGGIELYRSKAQHFRRVVLEQIRRMSQSEAAREHEDAQARYYQSVLQEQRRALQVQQPTPQPAPPEVQPMPPVEATPETPPIESRLARVLREREERQKREREQERRPGRSLVDEWLDGIRKRDGPG